MLLPSQAEHLEEKKKCNTCLCDAYLEARLKCFIIRVQRLLGGEFGKDSATTLLVNETRATAPDDKTIEDEMKGLVPGAHFESSCVGGAVPSEVEVTAGKLRKV